MKQFCDIVLHSVLKEKILICKNMKQSTTVKWVNKTQKTAVVIIPPIHLWSQIQSIRKQYDRKFKRWMPHITLIYPFIPKNNFAEFAEQFTKVCKFIKPFEITLKYFKSFRHSCHSHTIWLAPENMNNIITLQTRLWHCVPYCNETRKYDHGFTPHLSVGQIRKIEVLQDSIQKLQKKWKPITFLVSEISLIWRNDPPDDVFRIGCNVKLGDP